VTGQAGGGPLQTDPDQISGSLGNLRILFGFSQDDDQVNTVEDEQDLTNFRIVSDYVISLAQSWLNNLQFFGLQTQTPFFGTQLVLLSRQLSVIAESVNEVRFTLDSVFIGPAERQTLQIQFSSGDPSMFLEDLLTWIDSFASEEGPRLIQDGGKFAVGESFVPIGTQLQTLVAGAVTPANATSLCNDPLRRPCIRTATTDTQHSTASGRSLYTSDHAPASRRDCRSDVRIRLHHTNLTLQGLN
jgi:hypothetical protein